MELSTAEKFILIAQHPQKAKFIIPEQRRNAGMIGAILLDLAMDEKINIVHKRIRVKSQSTKISTVHSMVLKKLSSSRKEKKVKSWISNLAMGSGKYRRQLLSDMQRKKFLRIEKRRFLFIPYKVTWLQDKKARADLVADVRNAILQKEKLNSEMSALLGLIEATKSYRVISKDRTEVREIRKKLQEILKDDVISQEVNKVIREMQAAVLIAVTSTAVVATAGSGR